MICQSNNSKNNSQIPLKLWNSFLPSFLDVLCFQDLPCHTIHWTAALLHCRDDFQRFSTLVFSWWGSKEWFLWRVNDRAHYIRWKLVGSTSRKQKSLSSFCYLKKKKKKKRFASKKMFKTVYTSRNQPPHSLLTFGFAMPSHYSDLKYSSLHILPYTAWLHIETLRSQSFVQMLLSLLLF